MEYKLIFNYYILYKSSRMLETSSSLLQRWGKYYDIVAKNQEKAVQLLTKNTW